MSKIGTSASVAIIMVKIQGQHSVRRVSKTATANINGIAVPELCEQFCDPFGCFFNGYSEGWGGEVGDVDRFSNCHWIEEQKLQASDKREKDRFGTSVDVDFGRVSNHWVSWFTTCRYI